MNSHYATLIFVLVCCWDGVGRVVRASIIDGSYYGPYHHRIGGGYLYGTTGTYHRGPQQHRNIGLIGSTTTAAVAMPRYNNYNSGLRPYKNVIIPMSPYYWSPPKFGLLNRGNDHYRGRGSVSVIGRPQQQLFGGLIPKNTRKVVIGGPGGHVSQSFIRPNTHYGTAAFTVKH
ncbi:uncharacterized protein LOC114123169 [Aphis gossypii]|uniref:uncharacterized protein LOC114123169 n=1 Tax=Aphis gossypii TaxID=80765 RepID=UPI0021592011|nr:uncharacterized protein LOC114123169 [Aphis gossypii]XP_050058266.1 uncharacterized protein LOC114123169 [Aphis gossypii]